MLQDSSHYLLFLVLQFQQKMLILCDNEVATPNQISLLAVNYPTQSPGVNPLITG